MVTSRLMRYGVVGVGLRPGADLATVLSRPLVRGRDRTTDSSSKQ